MARREIWCKKFNVVNWDIVKAPKGNGGLGIRDSNIMNMAIGDKLFGKWSLGGKKFLKKLFDSVETLMCK